MTEAEHNALFLDALRECLGLRPMRGEGHGPPDVERFGRTFPEPRAHALSVFEVEKDLAEPRLDHARAARRRWQF